jgi:RNA polymerase sigma-B factor
MPTGATTQPIGSHTSSSDDSRQLFVRWQRHGDEAAREQLIRRYMPLARSLARRYGRSSEPFDDLLQVASMGLVKAVDRYDTSRGHPFQSFAVPTILGEMRRYFRDSGWAIHVPRGAQERALKVRDAQERISNETGRAPTVNQLAEFLEIDIEDVIDALQAIRAYETVSLDAPRGNGDEDVVAYGDTIGKEDERYELVELDATVSAALGHLPSRDRMVLKLRFVDDLTQTEIAERVGISQMQVSRLLRRSLEQLRTLTDAPTGAR